MSRSCSISGGAEIEKECAARREGARDLANDLENPSQVEGEA
jgi:hypothetical protein